MQFVHHDLGQRTGGEVVEVVFSGDAANVRLMDGSDFESYRSGREHGYLGGVANSSPVRFEIPRSGHWHVAVDRGGYGGAIESSVRVLRRTVPPSMAAPLSSVPSLAQGRPGGHSPKQDDEAERACDVFICHASEDRTDAVLPLAQALEDAGLSVCHDAFAFRTGESLRSRIDEGLESSRFGVVVLSPAFLAKGWPRDELDRLVTRTATGEQVLLPIWHNISKQEVMAHSASLADKLARHTGIHAVTDVAQEIADVIRRSRP